MEFILFRNIDIDMTLTLVGNAEKILRSELRYCPELACEEGDDDDNADD